MLSKRTLWLSIFILLVFFFSRITQADVFPLFIDETIHIHYGERMLEIGSPVYDDIGRLFTIWWLIPFQPAQAAPIWMARVAIVLVTLPGMAALLSFGREKSQIPGLLLVGLLIGLNSFLLFFGRLALADPAANSLIMVALYFAMRLKNRVSTREAILTGGLLFGAYGFKVASVYFAIIPIAAALTLKPTSRPWREQGRWLAWSMGTYTALFALFNLGLYAAGHSALLTGIRYALTGSAVRAGGASDLLALPNRILTHAIAFFGLQSHYAGLLIFGGVVLTVLLLVMRRDWFLPLVIVIPLIAIWAQSVQNSRYFVTPMSVLLVAGAVVLGDLLTRVPVEWRAVLITTLGIALFLHWTPYFWAAIHNPLALPLAERDLDEHVRSDAGSFGFQQVRDLLIPLDSQIVYGLLANCQGLRYTSLGDLNLECPRVNPNGEDIPALAALLAANQRPGAYAVLEDSPYIPADAPGTLLAVVEDASGRPALSIYDLAP